MAKKTATKVRSKNTARREEAPRETRPVRPPRLVPAFAPPGDSLAFVRSLVRDVVDFPKPGIVFKDITPLLASPRGFHIVLDTLAERFIGDHIDAVVGIEARGFIFGGALAARLNASFVPARKPGKLPHKSHRMTVTTEYSRTELEMHRDAIPEGARTLIVDDVLATGGTAKAACDLVHKQNGLVIAYAFAIELTFLGGRDKLLPIPIHHVLAY